MAEVHQPGVGGVMLVHPNIPEAKNLVIDFAKHPGGFLCHYLIRRGVDKGFVRTLMKQLLDPSLIHEAENCQWDPATCSITTPEELEEEEEGEQFAKQSWFKEIVSQYEEHKQADSRRSKNYASTAALYDLDATRSVKTTHEA